MNNTQNTKNLRNRRNTDTHTPFIKPTKKNLNLYKQKVGKELLNISQIFYNLSKNTSATDKELQEYIRLLNFKVSELTCINDQMTLPLKERVPIPNFK